MANKALVNELLANLKDPSRLAVRPPDRRFAPFYVGCTVRFTAAAEGQFPWRKLQCEGVVRSITNLSYCMPDDPNGARAFSLKVFLGGGHGSVEGNGCYFEPVE